LDGLKTYILIILSVFFVSNKSVAVDINLIKGNVGVEVIYYPTSVNTNQKDGNISVDSQFELFLNIDDYWSATISPLARLDVIDSNRNKIDLQDAYLNFSDEAWMFKIGMNTLSWSVTESVNTIPAHVVDIINQRDIAADSSGQEKLGTAMVNVGYQSENGLIVEALLLPWFREKEYPTLTAREHVFNGRYDLKTKPIFTSKDEEFRLSAAVRIEMELGSTNLALIQYQGYSLDPVLRINNQSVSKLYYLVDMSGITIQASLGTWLFKTETAYFNTSLNDDNFTVPDNYLSSVTGFEYTLIRPSEKADLIFFAEWMYDQRGDGLDGTIFQNDIFAGFRWVANDLVSTVISFGSVFDLDDSATILHFEYKRRMQNSMQLIVKLRSYNAEISNPVSTLNNDDFIDVVLRYYF